MFAYILCPLGYALTMLYAPYMSFKAIQTPSPDDDKQWLTFWVVFSMFSTAEIIIDRILFWFPFYYEVKVVFIVWLMFFNGAQTLFEKLIEPFMSKYESKIDSTLEEVKHKAEDALHKGQEAIKKKD